MERRRLERPAEMAQQSQREEVGSVGSEAFSRDGNQSPISSLLTNGRRYSLPLLRFCRFTLRLSNRDRRSEAAT